MSAPLEPGQPGGPDDARPGAAGPETFASQSDLKSYVARFVPALVGMVLLGWIIVTLLLNAVSVPLPGLFALVPAVALGVYGYRFQVRRHEEVHAAARLRLSAEGVELVDAHTRVHFTWADATRIGAGDMLGPMRVDLTDNAAVQAVGAATRASTKRTQEAIYGLGSMTIDPGASRLVRATIEQHLAGRDPQRTEVGAPLSVYDPDWREGRIGAWIREFRPDLLG